jgi:hypothetical protein
MAAPDDLPLSPYFAAIEAVSAALAEAAEGHDQGWFEDQETDIAACMAQEGFEYVPEPTDTPTGASAPRARRPFHYLAVPRLAAGRQDVAADGYGVLGPRRVLGDGLDVGVDDPNGKYYESLSAKAQAQYDDALYGFDQAEWFRTGEGIEPVEMGGCMGAAWERYPDPAVAAADASPVARFDELISDMGSVNGLGMFSDPELVELNREWRGCFPADLVVLLGDPAVIGSGPYGGPGGAFELALRATAVGDVVALDVPSVQLSEERRSLVGSAGEVSVALADFDCRVATDYLVRFTGIQRRIEERFVADHQRELDAMMAAISG